MALYSKCVYRGNIFLNSVSVMLHRGVKWIFWWHLGSTLNFFELLKLSSVYVFEKLVLAFLHHMKISTGSFKMNSDTSLSVPK